jgi:hypothetical protein
MGNKNSNETPTHESFDYCLEKLKTDWEKLCLENKKNNDEVKKKEIDIKHKKLLDLQFKLKMLLKDKQEYQKLYQQNLIVPRDILVDIMEIEYMQNHLETKILFMPLILHS